MSDIKVLGPGCKKCHTVLAEVEAAVEQTGVKATIQYITDINAFADYGVFLTPGLVINGQVKASGKVPKRAEIVRWLTEA
ncbi:MAG: thioredoxin family protein [Eubacteriales bacterium]|nr:TM0996/MTH895 family glutaredoxin-like protein [Bacillota bacterium]MBV1726540.1 TM0996/MTH895 family glutaredoxin-like protein [Desulforudis sp.]MDP3051208.1 thioredoxin family protein [Eubacteriales bacterium]MDQ7788605.1 thioredoxin family protein [Clostridia bacterium]MBU4532649.1 TM0996/MTH895 family glutaredoxin-like protein [Bacillota bacterium]